MPSKKPTKKQYMSITSLPADFFDRVTSLDELRKYAKHYHQLRLDTSFKLLQSLDEQTKLYHQLTKTERRIADLEGQLEEKQAAGTPSDWRHPVLGLEKRLRIILTPPSSEKASTLAAGVSL